VTPRHFSMHTSQQPEVLLHNPQHGEWLCFPPPSAVIQAHRHADVIPALHEIQQAVDNNNHYAAGFISYEAAPAFDPALTVRPPDPRFPLLWFGLFDAPTRRKSIPLPASTPIALNWTPSITREAYIATLSRLREYLYKGDSYQVNYTLRLLASFKGSPYSLFSQLVGAQGAHYSAFISTENFAICSASPELFFRMHNGNIEARPMKGTAPRGRTSSEDRQEAANLHCSEKNRAENVMIVDMIRNDMGRIAIPGSVTPVSLFTIERYPTVWQMTSTVTCKTQALFPEIMTALFPCASITGAPKPRTMRIIAEVEDSPRRIYTGAIGFLAPGGIAQFNVAIRTVLLDNLNHTAEYGVGGGIVWDSSSGDEYDECITKSAILRPATPAFSLLETLRWDSDTGFFLLDRHLHRLAESAEYFDFHFSLPETKIKLDAWAAESALTNKPLSWRIRLLLSASGTITIESFPLTKESPPSVCVGIASHPVDPQNRFLYHKTTYREIYENARSSCPGTDDVLLWNPKGEITESTIANVVVDMDGEMITPPVECGLLPGTFRDELLAQGIIKEGIIRLDNLRHGKALYLINSVRRWRPFTIASPLP
jgi:para-aminobenzoate synthetase/4-amino-4-deoxychorismate lyase